MQAVADYYARWLESGVHVITANKKVGAGPLERYQECFKQSKRNAQWLYETTGPGSGLPVLTCTHTRTTPEASAPSSSA